MKEESRRALAAWFGGGDTGISSETLAITALTGFPPVRASYPHDPADLGRCLRLIDRVPEVGEMALPILATHGDVWPRLVENWDDLERSFLDECGSLTPDRGTRADETYRRMNLLIYVTAT